MEQYIVDAFTDEIFHGNQAAVCFLEKWPNEKLMMNIAKENNFSETAFVVKVGEKYHLRWFTPESEIDLCGHATLACAFVLFNFYAVDSTKIIFKTLSGDLTVERKGELFEMQFPAYNLRNIEVTDDMVAAIGARPTEAYLGRDLLCVFEDEKTIRGLCPNMQRVKKFDGLLLQTTARGELTDCVSRTFAPKLGIDEDPVCGSGHCHIAPYWSKKLGKNQIIAVQASKRGGILYCKCNDDKVIISGKAVLFAKCELNIKGL